MATGAYLGIEGMAFYSTTGVGGTWLDLDIIGDVRMSLSHKEGEIDDRAQTWEGTLIGHKVGSVTFRLSRKVANSVWEAMRDAFVAKTELGFAFMSGDIVTVGSEGLQANCYVVGFDVSEPDDGPATVDVTVKPSGKSSTAPTFTEISA